MKNLITRILMMAALLVIAFAPISSAQMGIDMEDGDTYETSGVAFTIDGWVAISGTSPAQPVVGATVTCEDCSPPITDTTDSNGYYRLNYHSYCGSKEITVTKTGYRTQTKNVTDNTCPECYCEIGDLDCMALYECGSGKRVIFYMVPGGSIDTDSDGVLDSWDNCYRVPNGPDLGTCTRGRRGLSCQSHSQCGCDGYCSKWQEDCDADGIGNACDECVVTSGGCKSGPCPQFMSFAEITPSHKLLGPRATTLMSDADKRTFWFILKNLWWTAHNPTSYDSAYSAFRGLIDGPEYLCNECVRDYNNNGICDGEENIFYTPVEILESLQEAYVRCQEKFDYQCSDPDYREANPWDCIW